MEPITEEIIIVYYIYINPNKNWKSIIGGQLEDLKNVQLLDYAKVFCVICTPNNELFEECNLLINQICQGKSINSHVTVNNFEYPGIKKLHELGSFYPDKLFLYMHSKGMVFHGTPGRTRVEHFLLINTIKYWKYILNIFKNYNFIDKAGVFPDHTGIIWYNFFWISGSFLKELEPPIITDNRHYYEHNYIINKNSQNNCFSLLTYELSRFSCENACVIVPDLILHKLNFSNYFNWKKYLLKYPDLKILKNKKKLYNHFITNGINENRNLI
jgi:hypothetical protein